MMKYFYILCIVCALGISSNAQTIKCKHTKIFQATIKITATQSYCGGAKPPQELITELQTPKPFEGIRLYVVKDKIINNSTKVLASIVTDADGFAKINLPKGTYYVIEKKQTIPLLIPKNDITHTYDINCLKRKWQTPLFTLAINSNDSLTTHNIHKKCDFIIDCCQYTGPLPP